MGDTPPPDPRRRPKTLPKTGVTTALEAHVTLCHVPRWSIIPLTRHQSVAEHSFRVAAILREFSRSIRHPWSPDILALHIDLALTHDQTEAVTGDLPEPFKKELREATSEGIGHARFDQMVANICPWAGRDTAHYPYLKAADTIEALSYIKNYGQGGLCAGIVRRLETILANMMDEFPEDDSAVFNSIYLDLLRIEGPNLVRGSRLW